MSSSLANGVPAPKISAQKLRIFQMGAQHFVLFGGVERLRQEFRLLCASIHYPKGPPSTTISVEGADVGQCGSGGEFGTIPVVLMPEQVQVLIENGFAHVQRIDGAGDGCADALLTNVVDGAQNNNDNGEKKHKTDGADEERFRDLARRMVIGRKIKARKRALAGGTASAVALKVRKLDEKLFDSNAVDDADAIKGCGRDKNGRDGDEGCSPEELATAVAELMAKEAEKVRKATTDDDGAPLPQQLAYVSPSCSSTLVKEPVFPDTREYGVKLKVFRDLWRKGFYLACGAKFGCDFLAYERPPPEQHSVFMVLCGDVNEAMRPIGLISVSRASTQVKKRILLAFVGAGSALPYYLEVNWWKGDGDR